MTDKMPLPKLWAVMPAAGVGKRFGADRPKQYLSLAGATLIEHSLSALLGFRTEDGRSMSAVMVALSSEDEAFQSLAIHKTRIAGSRLMSCLGGAERADSVLAGLEALADLADEDDWVLVHDAARPGLSAADLQALIDTAEAVETEEAEEMKQAASARKRIEGDRPMSGAILAIPVADTIKRAAQTTSATAQADCIDTTVDRSGLWRAQTPQMFRFGILRKALKQGLAQGLAITDEASAIEALGLSPALVLGSEANLKVTRPEDLALAGFYLEQSNTEGDSQ